MNFFAEQRRALEQSKRLLALFAAAVVLIAFAVGVVSAFGYAMFGSRAGDPRSMVWAGSLGGLAALAVIFLASWIKTTGLKAGGGVVARRLGGTFVPPDTTNPSYRRLRNVVEEMAIASGLPVPEIYVLEQEPGVNAFAAGHTPSDAAIAVTRGALDHLSRAELQGVVAHEFSHILNGDMRLNIRLMGLLFGILVLGIIGRNVLRHGRGGRNGRGAGPLLLVALALVIVGHIGVFFGRLIKAGVSRQREFLADASAVQFTRDNRAVAGALKKIAVLAEGSRLSATDGEEISHMLFGDGIGYSRLFATHPPLLERIKRIEPGFRTEMLAELAQQLRRRRAAESEAEEQAELRRARERFPGGLAQLPGSEALPSGAAGAVFAGALLSGAAAAPALGAEAKPAAAPRVAHPSLDHVRFAELLRAELPSALTEAAHMHDHAPDLVLAVLVDAAGAARSAALALIAERRGSASREAVEALLPHFQALHPLQRAPLLAMAFPALKRRPRQELEALIELVQALIHLDGEVSVFEYALGTDLATQLSASLEPSTAQLFGRARLPELLDAAASVLAVLAMHGHADPDSARRAYLRGLHVLAPQAALPYREPSDWVAVLDAALPRLDRLQPEAKALLVQALQETLHHDGRIAAAEAEILRAICARLHCPMPPLLPD